MKTPVIKGIMLDYGGTIDTNGVHWAEVFWAQYRTENVPVTKELFRAAYQHAERTLALQPLIQPEMDFADTLAIKTGLQLAYLSAQGCLPHDTAALAEKITRACDALVRQTIEKARPVLDALAQKYPLALVSNFYGNLNTVLERYSIRQYFNHVVESAVAGVRKPDPAIFLLGIELLECKPEETAMIGDTYSKDIAPAKAAGCTTIWLKGQEWETTTVQDKADYIIYGLEEVTRSKLFFEN
ncbi:MAG: HAD family hydrolase [Bacteroidales bacterium]|jgi:putative hydrolase of the HAD superfamily|nr:HAD family hydrolase [Bacteroidales bacterium]